MSTLRAFIVAVFFAWILMALAGQASAVPILCHCCLDMKWCAIFAFCC